MLPDVITVAELNRLARSALEREFPLLWIAGEISNLTRAPSGHCYFTLKDERAQARCAMFRARAQSVPWRFENGDQVEARALVTLYEPRGDFQLNVESLRRAGVGKLYEAFLRLRDRLAGEGLLAESRKRPLPHFPHTVGIVTSARAAALHDVVAAMRRRAPNVHVIVYPTLVQGGDAPGRIVAALTAAGLRRECELLLLVRGGGSLEDLWAFNDEAVARAIAASPVPVISGVGHETDVTIADLVADHRAATPTAAAEFATAGWFEAADRVRQAGLGLAGAIDRRLDRLRQGLDLLAGRLVHPRQRLLAGRQRVAHLALALRVAAERRLQRQHGQLDQTTLRLARARPALESRRTRLERLGAGLAALNPQAALARGYALVRTADGQLVRSHRQLAEGMTLSLRFAEGGADALVSKTVPD